jgi:hypothetical protein
MMNIKLSQELRKLSIIEKIAMKLRRAPSFGVVASLFSYFGQIGPICSHLRVELGLKTSLRLNDFHFLFLAHSL